MPTCACFSAPSARRVPQAICFLMLGLVSLHGFTSRTAAAQTPRLEFRPGDHICLIGNTLADRMQHDGWLETLLQSRLPKHQLYVRDLGFSGDELTVRLRSANFGSPDHWLSFHKADVVIAFFGYNESFAGREGLPKFKKDLEEFIQHTRSQKYNGKEAPRLVLVSPIAHEDLHDRNLPDGRASNERLELYTAAMAEVARAQNVPFIDLFHPSRDAYPRAARPWTINGVHLNADGNWEVARLIDRALFPQESELSRDQQSFERLRQAVVDKNFYWFNRYRTVDGYNVYGGRAYEKYAEGQTNLVVMQREMEILDVKAANRDRRIWAVTQGGDLKVEDDNLPPLIPTKTNKPGPGPNGTHLFLSGEEAISKMTLAKGLRINLFASEKEFPELAKPVQMAFDARGRLWVAAWPTYPHWKPTEEMSDKLLILEDTDGDGKADKVTVFADHLNCPTGFEFYNGGVLIAEAPGLVFLKDTDGDGKADLRVRALDGLDSADTHHTANSFTIDPGGAIYFQEGVFHRTQVETPYGPPVRCADAGVYRYEPRTQKFETYASYPFANPHGHVWDRWGQDIVYDGTTAAPYHGAVISGHLEYPQKHPSAPQVYQQRTRPCPGAEYLSSRHFPESMQGNLLVANVIGFQGILQYKVFENGSSLGATEVEPLVSSTDLNFRPSDLKVGPDGALYFLDWQNPIIGHLQHHLRDPNRDRTHGRIYRITAEGRPLLHSPTIAGEPIDKLLDLLKEPEDRVRSRAKIELGSRESDAVIQALARWIPKLDKQDPQYEHNLLEALWVHQYHNVVNQELLKRMLGSSDFRARAAATRVLCYWRDRVPDALELLKRLAQDEHPRVRLEAVRAASFFTVPEALEVPLLSAQLPSDRYLDYVRKETLRALEPYWKRAVAEGRDIPITSDAGARFFLGNISTDDLLKMKRSRAVNLELLFRRGIRDEYRREALAGLARLLRRSEPEVLVDAITSREASTHADDDSVMFDLVRLLTDRPAATLAAVRPALEKLATSAQRTVTRQLGFVALIAADGSADRAWTLASRSAGSLLDLVSAMPLIREPSVRASLYPRVEPLLHGLPAHLANVPAARNVSGQFVRIELPRRGTLTLAEVEVYSDGQNIARQGKASQKNTAYGGVASRAIDGNTNGNYGASSQTHTEEETTNPWWQVDLGADRPIDSIVIYNRTDDGLGKRLDGFTVKIVDSRQTIVFEERNQPAPAVKAVVHVSESGGVGGIRRAAMHALTYVRGQETAAFRALAPFLREGPDRATAIQALERIPTAYWPKEEARPLLDSLLAYIRQLPPQARTSPEALDALQIGDTLAALLPAEQARQARKELGNLGVRILRLGTVPDQMLFDKERLAVQVGKPVEVRFENNDLMPHNWVLTQPGALEEIGLQAEVAATQPGAAERHYVPQSSKILQSSLLLQPRTQQHLMFTAPAQPGVYPYVCTYPGHWRRMFGALYVVADLEAYQADPEGYLAQHRLPIKDELLKFNRPRKEWKLEELAGAAEAMHKGRNFGNGKQLFTVANCVACHRLGGTGAEFGPDLTKLDPKLKPVEILRDMLEPSFKINEKYYSYVIETQSGRLITGLILEETPEIIKVIENPLVKNEAIVIKRSEIVERKKSPISIMPKGLLDKLTQEEILDLLAYVVAGGNGNHPLFQGAHDHSHGGGH